MIDVKTNEWENIRAFFQKYLLNIEKYEILEELLIHLMLLVDKPVLLDTRYETVTIASENSVINLLSLTLETTHENALIMQRFYKDINPKFNPEFIVLNGPSLQTANNKINIIFSMSVDPNLVGKDLLPLFEEFLSTTPWIIAELYAKQRYRFEEVSHIFNPILIEYGLPGGFANIVRTMILSTVSRQINLANQTRRFFDTISFPKELRALSLEYLGVLHSSAIETTEDYLYICTQHESNVIVKEHYTLIGFGTSKINALRVVDFFNRFNKNLAEYCGEFHFTPEHVLHTQSVVSQTVSIRNVAFAHPYFISHFKEALRSFSRIQFDRFREEYGHNLSSNTKILNRINRAKNSLISYEVVDKKEKASLLAKIKDLENFFNQQSHFTIKELDCIQKLLQDSRFFLALFRERVLSLLKSADAKADYHGMNDLVHTISKALDGISMQSRWYLDNQDKCLDLVQAKQLTEAEDKRKQEIMSNSSSSGVSNSAFSLFVDQISDGVIDGPASKSLQPLSLK